jgi:glycosyltransferase involved in cell wall biosynthesis
MNWLTDCAAVIPCLNEEATIGPLVSGVRRHASTVFVVDDGSSDKTAIIAQRAGAEVLRQNRSSGKGAALQTGWRFAFQRGFRWALTLDGDGQHSPEDIPKFFRCAENEQAHLVVGNRMDQPAEMPFVRRFVNRWMSKRISKIAHQPLPDTQCGFRLMNLRPWHELPIHSTHFEIESEVLLAFVFAGYRVDFVPIRVIYKMEQSKIHPLRDTLRWFRWWSGVRNSRSARFKSPSD